MPPPGDRFRLRGLFRGVPAVVWLLTGTFAALLLLHTAITPLYRAPDEARHVDQVLALREGRGYPPPGKEVLSQEVLGSYWAAGYASEGPNGIGVPDPRTDIRTPLPLQRDKAPDLAHAPAYKDVPPLQRPLAQLNQMTQHPPLYYAIGAAVLWVMPDDQDLPFPWVIGILRLLSVACLVLLPLLAFATARRLGLAPPACVTAAVVPLAIPQLAHVGSAVSNDSLLIGLMSVLTVALTFVATGDLSKRTALYVGLLTAAALFTKAFALAALPWIVVAYGVALWRTRSRLAVGGAIVAGATSLLGGWWYVVNVLRYGSVQSEQTVQRNYHEAPPGFSPSLATYLHRFASQVSQRFWGEFGYLEIPLPPAFTTTATVVLLALLVLGAVSIRPLLPGLSLLAPLLLVAAIMMAGTYGLYRKYAIFPGLQGRYLFPALAAVSVLVAAGLFLVSRRFAPLVALVLAGGAQVYGSSYELDKFWGGSLRTVAAWSWYPGFLVYVVFALLVAGAVGALGLMVREVPR
ncbi:MAG: phospholipid carrier-dependent glycosyltransferase [Mycobacteriales bacterium]